jgi:Ca-activated chloride channel family protein
MPVFVRRGHDRIVALEAPGDAMPSRRPHSITHLSLASLLGFALGGCIVDIEDGGDGNQDDVGDGDGDLDEAEDDFGETGDGVDGDGDLDGESSNGDDATDDSGDGDEFGDDTGDDGTSGFDEGTSDDADDDEEEEETTTDDTTETGEPLCNDVDPVVLYLSPDDSNSTSSPAQVKDLVLDDGETSLAGVPIRPWEFMNYYGFPYEAAGDGELATYAAMQPVQDAENRYRMQIAVASELMLPEERPPLNLTLVMDTSGSMAGEAIVLLRETGKVIAAQLRPGDTVSMVEWDTENTWVLAGYEVEGPNDPLVIQEIDALQAGGGTDLNAGLLSGYELAQAVFDPNALNRLVLISDGGANAGVVEPGLIAENAAYGGADGIYLVGVGVRSSSVTYNDELMDVVTDQGKGASLFIHTQAEAQSMFGDRFLETMAIAAREVQVELTMPPGFEIVKFSGEEFGGNPEEIEPQHIAPNDAIVFHQQVETCAPELVSDDATITVELTWQDVWTFEPRQASQQWTFAELYAADPALMLKGAAVLAYAEGLRDYKTSGPDALAEAAAAVETAQAALPGDQDLVEIAAVLDALTP